MTQYQTIYSVIRDCGDGSQIIEWRKTWSDEIHKRLENDKYGRYQSGDGVQMKEWRFPPEFDIDAWAKINSIYWMDDEEYEDYEDLEFP